MKNDPLSPYGSAALPAGDERRRAFCTGAQLVSEVVALGEDARRGGEEEVEEMDSPFLFLHGGDGSGGVMRCGCGTVETGFGMGSW